MSETNETNGTARTIDVISLYPKDMNIYGDSGNVLTIARRLALYGYAPCIHEINQGDPWPAHVDMILAAAARIPDRRRSSTTCSPAPTTCAHSPRTVCRC